MKISKLSGVFLVSIYILACSGSQDSPRRQHALLLASHTRQVPAFDYVAIEFSDFDDIYNEINEFRREMDSQQIIRTGPFFLMEFREPPYDENSSLKWAIGCATAEGQMVRVPLIGGKWHSQFALVSRLQAPVEWLKDAGTTWFIASNDSRIKTDGIIVNRFLALPRKIRKGMAIPIEVWVPVFPPASPPVTVRTIIPR